MNIFIIFKVIADCVIQSVTAGVENEITWEHLQISPIVQKHPSIFLAYLMRHLLRKLNSARYIVVRNRVCAYTVT